LTFLEVGGGSTNLHRIYVKFVVNDLPPGATAVVATLQLHANTTAAHTIDVHCGASNAWSASTLTWMNQPGYHPAIVSSLAATTAGTWATFDVSACVHGNGTYSVVLDQSSGTNESFDSSRATSNRPRISTSYQVDDNLVVVTDCCKGTHSVFLLDPHGTWSEGGALWSWSAEDSPQIDPAHRSWFDNPTEAKLRDDGRTLLVASGAGNGTGGVAVIRTIDKAVLFYALGGSRTHSLERLPDGNLVSVSSTDNLIRIISTDTAVSHWPDHVVHTDYVGSLPHGVVWDAKTHRLWINGNHGLDAYIYNGDRQNPKLTKDTHFDLPNSEAGGHDLFPVAGQRKLFVTDNSVSNHIYTFDLDLHTYKLYDPDHPHFKGVGLNSAGKLVGNTESQDVYFAVPGGTWTDKPLGAGVYKSRWWRVTEIAP
jgi:DNA-binding beta-propeller fold protein YncE